MVAKRHKITNVPLFEKILTFLKVLAPSKYPSKGLKKLLSRKKKNYVPHFLKQRDINSYIVFYTQYMYFFAIYFPFSRRMLQAPGGFHF